MLCFRGRHFLNILDFLDNYSSNSEWEGWIARQQRVEPEPAAQSVQLFLYQRHTTTNNNRPICGFRYSRILKFNTGNKDYSLWWFWYSYSPYYVGGKDHIILIVVIAFVDSESFNSIIIRWGPLLYSFNIEKEACSNAIINSEHYYQDLHFSSTGNALKKYFFEGGEQLFVLYLKFCWYWFDDDLDYDNPTNNPNNNPQYSSNNFINATSCNWYPRGAGYFNQWYNYKYCETYCLDYHFLGRFSFFYFPRQEIW